MRINREGVIHARKYGSKWVLETNDDTMNKQEAAIGNKGYYFSCKTVAPS